MTRGSGRDVRDPDLAAVAEVAILGGRRWLARVVMPAARCLATLVPGGQRTPDGPPRQELAAAGT